MPPGLGHCIDRDTTTEVARQRTKWVWWGKVGVLLGYEPLREALARQWRRGCESGSDRKDAQLSAGVLVAPEGKGGPQGAGHPVEVGTIVYDLYGSNTRRASTSMGKMLGLFSGSKRMF